MSLNASLNDNVTFTCSAKAEFVYWAIDNHVHTNTYIMERGITESLFSYDPNGTMYTSLLMVPCTTVNNNTQLQCIAVAGDEFHISNISLLLIQGK